MTHRIGILGLHHDHVWGNVDELSRIRNAEIVAAADTNQPLLDQFSEKYPDAKTYDSHEALLENEELTAVYVFGSNKLSEDLTIAACERGLHCLVEKPMAATLAGADKMLAAAEANNVRLVINWPFTWWSQLRHAIELASNGDIGQLWQVKYRAAHQGPVELGCSSYFCDWLYDAELNGAGALMDYCCYGAALSQVLLGSPNSVTGIKLNTGLKPDLTLEDNAILVMNYNNAIATTEASWTQIGKITSYTTAIYGSEGTFLVEPNHDGKLIKATLEDPEGSEVPVPEQSADLESTSSHFIHLIENPDASVFPLCEMKICRDTQEILEAGLQAADKNQNVTLPVTD